MVVDYLDIDRLTVDPTKADAVLVVDAEAPLSRPAAGQLFQAVRVRNPEVQRFRSGVEAVEEVGGFLMQAYRKGTACTRGVGPLVDVLCSSVRDLHYVECRLSRKSVARCATSVKPSHENWGLMKFARWFLISIADWLDDVVLRHRFYRLCQLLGGSPWWAAAGARDIDGVPTAKRIWGRPGF